MTTTTSDASHHHDRPGPATNLVIARGVTSLVLLSLGIATVVRARAVRAGEARISALLIGALTHTETYVWRARGSFYWGIGSHRARGLHISPACSLAYVAGPLLVVFGLLLLLGRLPQRQVVAGVLAGIGLMVVVNTVRMVLIAESINLFDSPSAFWWAHIVAGSLLAVVGNVVALALALRIAFRNRRAEP